MAPPRRSSSRRTAVSDVKSIPLSRLSSRRTSSSDEDDDVANNDMLLSTNCQQNCGVLRSPITIAVAAAASMFIVAGAHFCQRQPCCWVVDHFVVLSLVSFVSPFTMPMMNALFTASGLSHHDGWHGLHRPRARLPLLHYFCYCYVENELHVTYFLTCLALGGNDETRETKMRPTTHHPTAATAAVVVVTYIHTSCT